MEKVSEDMEKSRSRVGAFLNKYGASDRDVAEEDETIDAALAQDAMAAEQVRDARLFYHLMMQKQMER